MEERTEFTEWLKSGDCRWHVYLPDNIEHIIGVKKMCQNDKIGTTTCP